MHCIWIVPKKNYRVKVVELDNRNYSRQNVARDTAARFPSR